MLTWILLACICTIAVLLFVVIKQNIKIGAYEIADKRRKDQEKKLLAQIEKLKQAEAKKPLTQKADPKTFKVQGAMQLMNLMQAKSRIVDFAHEDISAFSDEQVGSVARFVHQGMSQILKEQFLLDRILVQNEGQDITYDALPDASQIRVHAEGMIEYPAVFNVVHRGWRIKQANLPEVTESFRYDILKPAEVEKTA